jgi:hypothetical protein
LGTYNSFFIRNLLLYSIFTYLLSLWARKRLTNQNGFMLDLEANQTYAIDFVDANYPPTISYTGGFFGLNRNQYLIIKHRMQTMPDKVTVFSTQATKSLNPLSMSQNANGDWYWEDSIKTLSYIVHNKAGVLPFFDAVVSFSTIKCAYPNCQTPVTPQPNPSGLPTSRPSTAIFWSNISTWQSAYIIRSGQIVTTVLSLPQHNDSIQIPSGVWVVVDIALPVLKRVQIDGVLEFNDSLDNTFSAENIFINGGQLIVGWENQRFTHNLNIQLTGDKKSELYTFPNGVNTMGTKAIGVYGGLDLHGIPRQPSWTKLSQTAKAGANQITLSQPVDWKVNEEIVISTTSYSVFQTETFKITAVSRNNLTLTLNKSLQFDHIAASQTFPNGKSYSVAAGVGLLTRNIKITGTQYKNQNQEFFGSRIIVSQYGNYDSSNKLVMFEGFARIENVEFNLFGQLLLGSIDTYTYGVLFSNLGSYDSTRPSYINGSAFHNGFSGAIGIFSSASIPIVNNVIYQTYDSAIWVEGNSNIIRNNFVALNLWSPTVFTQYAAFNSIKFTGAIEISKSASAVVENNLIAGSQRVGLHFRGSPCAGSSVSGGYAHSIKGNSIYGTYVGALILPFEGISGTCVLISQFTIYKTISIGIYVAGFADLAFDSNILIDNQMGIYHFIYGIASTSHVFVDRSVNVTNNLIIGTSPSFNCDENILPNDLVSKNSGMVNYYNTITGGKIGLVWSNIQDGTNDAPSHPWTSILTYNYINGLTTIGKLYETFSI